MSKRTNEDTSVPDEPPLKKQRLDHPPPLTSAYVVTRLDVSDSYKNHYPPSVETLGIFRSYSQAKAVKREEMFRYVRSRLEDNGKDDDDDSMDEYWIPHDSDDGEAELNWDRVNEDVEELFDRFSEGEFVPSKILIEIHECSVDNDGSLSSDDDDAEPSSSQK